MSLAGVDPTASTGIPGDATKAKQVENVAEEVESRTERRQEIAHTNISMGLDVITKQFIYTGTYSWKTTDQPGAVLATFPIHPDSCNSYTNHVYQMFNAWVGGMKARIRIIGTAFYGGGLYFVRIPPNFSATDIAQMNLQGFSAFPHSDMDPKNLSSIDIDLQDYRSQHFHSGELLLDNPLSFAGWLAIVVNARLVTQSPDVHSLDLRVEMAGNFDFKVPRPIRDKPSEATGPLSSRSLTISQLRGCDDIASGTGSYLAILPNTYNKITNGHVFMRRSGGEWTYTPDVNASFLNVGRVDVAANWKMIIAAARLALDAGTFTGIASHVLFYQQADYLAMHISQLPNGPGPDGISTNWKQINFLVGTGCTGSWGYTEDKSSTYGIVKDVKFFETDRTDYMCAQVYLDANAKENGIIAFDSVLWTTLDSAVGPERITHFMAPNFPDPYIGNESYVGIVTNNTHTFSAQPLEWAQDFKAFNSWPEGSAALYDVYDTNHTKVAQIKLRSNGHAYAVGTKNAVTLPPGATLRFDQWVPQEYVLTPVPAQVNLYTNACIEASMKKMTEKFSSIASPSGVRK